MFDADPVARVARELLRERVPALVAEACAWVAGTSDAPHLVRRGGRVARSGVTLGVRAASGLPLGGDEDAPLVLGEARPGSFADALSALDVDGRVLADRFEEQVLAPYALETCLLAAGRVQRSDPAAWEELLDDLGEDGSDPEAMVRAAEWEAPLRTEAEQLALAALGQVPLVEVEVEGLPLSLVRAAEALARGAVPVKAAPVSDEDLAGALFLAETALSVAGLAAPVREQDAAALLAALLSQGLEPEEVLAVLPHLPVQADAEEEVALLLDVRRARER